MCIGDGLNNMRNTLIKKILLSVMLLCGIPAVIIAEETHPCAFFNQSDIPAFKEKIKQDFFSQKFNDCLYVARAALTSSTNYEYYKSENAMYLSFAVLLMDSDDPERAQYAAKAREILLTINDGVWSGTGGVGTVNWNWDGSNSISFWYPGGTILKYVFAYDWLVGAGELSGAERQKVRSRLLFLANLEYNELTGAPKSRFVNGRLRSCGGVGMAALVFSEQEGIIHDPENLLSGEQIRFNASEVINYVIQDLFVKEDGMDQSDDSNQGSIANVVARDGAYLEGQSYQQDSFISLQPFLHAYMYRTGINFLKGDNGFDDRLIKMFEWNIKTALPNGRPPTVDTGWYGSTGINHSWIVSFAEHPEWHEWYFRNIRKESDQSIYTIILYDGPPDVSIEKPPFLTTFLPESGYAVFRDSWDKDATYMLLLAEHLPNRSNHEQADQTSFILYSKGAYLAIDPGDGRAYRKKPDDLYTWKSYSLSRSEVWLQSGFGHNLITVDSNYDPSLDVNWKIDGCHPQVVYRYSKVVDPAYLQNTMTKKNIDYAEAVMDYSEVDVSITRSVAFVRHQYFIIEDSMEASSEHDYNWQIHFGQDKALTGSLSVSDSRHSWTIPNEDGELVTLDVDFLKDPGSVELYNDGATNYDGSTYPDDVYDHTYVLARTHAQNKKYLVLLNPRWASDAPFFIEELVLEKAWKITVSDSQYDIVVSQDQQNLIETGMFSTDAEFLIISFDTSNTEMPVQNIFAKSATIIKLAGYKTIILDNLGDGIFYFTQNGFNLRGSEDDEVHYNPGTGDLYDTDKDSTDQLDEPVFAYPTIPFDVTVYNNIITPEKTAGVTIHYEMTQPGRLKIALYGTDGREIIVLRDEQRQPHIDDIIWDGKDFANNEVGSGMYFIRCILGDAVITKKVIILR